MQADAGADHAVFHDYVSGVTREVQYPIPGTPPVYKGKTRWRLESQEDPATHLWHAVGVAKAHHHGRQRWNVMLQHRLPNSTPSSRKTARQGSAMDTVSSLYRCARWRGRVLKTMSKSSIALAGRAVFRRMERDGFGIRTLCTPDIKRVLLEIADDGVWPRTAPCLMQKRAGICWASEAARVVRSAPSHLVSLVSRRGAVVGAFHARCCEVDALPGWRRLGDVASSGSNGTCRYWLSFSKEESRIEFQDGSAAKLYPSFKDNRSCWHHVCRGAETLPERPLLKFSTNGLCALLQPTPNTFQSCQGTQAQCRLCRTYTFWIPCRIRHLARGNNALADSTLWRRAPQKSQRRQSLGRLARLSVVWRCRVGGERLASLSVSLANCEQNSIVTMRMVPCRKPF